MRLAALVFIVGIVLLPLRAVAATVPMLIAYDAVVGHSATTPVERGPSLRPERGRAPEYGYDAVQVGYDGAANPHALDGGGAVHAYDRVLELTERREVGEGVIYVAPAAMTAAEEIAAAAEGLGVAERSVGAAESAYSVAANGGRNAGFLKQRRGGPLGSLGARREASSR